MLDDDVWMDTEITQLNERLTSLEREFAVQAEVTAVEKTSYANKEDISRIEALLVNCATKQDVARIEASLAATKTEIAGIDASLAATKSDIARVEASQTATKTDIVHMDASLTATRIDVARIDAVLDSIQKNYATKADLLQLAARMAQMETHLTRWMLATLITVAGMSGSLVLTIVKLVQ